MVSGLLAAILVSIIVMAYFMNIWMGKYSKKLAEYSADFEFLPELTRKVDSIKNELHRATELQLGLKSEERKAIFEMAASIEKSINMSTYIGDFLVDYQDYNEVLRIQHQFQQQLMELDVMSAKLEILCDNENLRNSVAEVIESIRTELVPHTTDYIITLLEHATKLKFLNARLDLAWKIPDIKEAEKKANELTEEHSLALEKHRKNHKLYCENVYKSHGVVMPLRMNYISSARNYLNMLEEQVEEAEKNDEVKGLPKPSDQPLEKVLEQVPVKIPEINTKSTQE